MPKSRIALPLTIDHYTAIGRVTARAAAFDAAIDAAIWTLLGVNETLGRIVTVRRNTSDRLKRLEALCREVVREENDIRVPSILGTARAASKDRNRIIHALWSAGEAANPISHRFDLEKGLRHFKDDWPVPKIEAVATALDNAAGNILDLFRLLEPSEPIPSPRKSEIPGLRRARRPPADVD